MNAGTPNESQHRSDALVISRRHRCWRTARIPAHVGICRWCWTRFGPAAFDTGLRAGPSWIVSPQSIAFEPIPRPLRLLVEFLACTLIGFAFVGVIQFVTDHRLHGLDLRGLLPLSALPHVACFGLLAARLVAWLREAIRLSGGLWFTIDAAVALPLALVLMVVSWTNGPVWMCQAASAELPTYELLKVLGVHIDARDSRGYTALHYAAEAGDVLSTRSLLERGAEVDPNDTAGTPLTRAASQGRLEVVKLLVAAGANVQATNRHGLTPLALAIKHDRPEVAAFLSQYAPN